MADELELVVSDRLRALLEAAPTVIAIAGFAGSIGEVTPSGVAASEGLVIALDNVGGDARSATTGDAPNAGKDNLSFFLCLSATKNIPERSGGKPDEARIAAKRAVINACGVLRRVVKGYASDPRVAGDPPESMPLWHKIEFAQPGWDYPEAEGQYRQGRIYLRVFTQQRRG